MSSNDNMDKEAKGDIIDALGKLPWWPKSDSGPKATVNLSPHSETYLMNHRNRGKCLIFSNKIFDPHTNLSCRRGTEEDAKNLKMRFRELDFDVDLHENLTRSEILNILKKESEESHTDDDCFACCILTHGDLGVLYGRDQKFNIDKIFEFFRGDNCPSLAGKPKLFFIQACQGDKLDSGIKVSYSADSSVVCKIPTHADFLVAYSTVPGFYSWRNTSEGSWFIQSLCTVLEQYSKHMHLLDMLTVVNRIVAYCFESRVLDNAEMNMMKQVPFVTSTLTRKIYFPCKLGQ